MNNYPDLVRLIAIVRTEIEMLEQEQKINTIFSERSNHLNLRMSFLKGKLADYLVIEEEIRVNIEKLEGLSHKIAKLRFIDNYSYGEIANMLGHSLSDIRQVVSRGSTKQAAKG